MSLPLPTVPKPCLRPVWVAKFISEVSAIASTCRPTARWPVGRPAWTSISCRVTASLSRKSVNRRVSSRSLRQRVQAHGPLLLLHRRQQSIAGAGQAAVTEAAKLRLIHAY